MDNALYNFDCIQDLDDSRTDWKLRVKSQAVWKGITKKTNELRGYNIIFFDDYSTRIHAFITSQIVPQFEEDLTEEQMYVIQNFKVLPYNGDETSRAVRTNKHIYFTSETVLLKETVIGLKFPYHSFDFRGLNEMEVMKNDNRFLMDVVAVVETVLPKSVYIKEDVQRSHVPFTITDGRTTKNVTFFNEFGDAFLEAYEKIKDQTVVIVIACAKVSEWKEVVYLSNFPATRFYLNLNHYAVNDMADRYAKPDSYVMDMDDEDENVEVPVIKIKELKNLDETFVQKKVSCQVTLKKFDEKMNWFSPYCIQCENDMDLVDGNYKCCGRNYPYPGKRFRLYGLCCDDSGTVPVVWPDEEVCRLIGKTVYDVDADEAEGDAQKKIPDILQALEKKAYCINIVLIEENLKQGSKVYHASNISTPLEITDNHDPTPNMAVTKEQTEITNDMSKAPISNINSPATEKSTNKCKSRIPTEMVEQTITNAELKDLAVAKDNTEITNDITQAPLSNINSPATEKSTNKSQSKMPVKMVELPVKMAVTKDQSQNNNDMSKAPVNNITIHGNKKTSNKNKSRQPTENVQPPIKKPNLKTVKQEKI